MTHARCQEALVSLLYRELAPREAAAVEVHLAACDECRAERDRLAATLGVMRRLEAEPPPRRGEAELLAAARAIASRQEAERRAHARPEPMLPPWLWKVSLTAAALAVVGTVSLQVLSMREHRTLTETAPGPIAYDAPPTARPASPASPEKPAPEPAARGVHPAERAPAPPAPARPRPAEPNRFAERPQEQPKRFTARPGEPSPFAERPARKSPPHAEVPEEERAPAFASGPPPASAPERGSRAEPPPARAAEPAGRAGVQPDAFAATPAPAPSAPSAAPMPAPSTGPARAASRARAAASGDFTPTADPVGEVERLRAQGRLRSSVRRFEACGPGEEVERRLDEDEVGRPRAYTVVRGEGADAATTALYYDDAGRLAGVVTRSRQGERRVDPNGPGAPRGQDPREAFESTAECPEK